MPTATFNIASGIDDQYVGSTSATYPPPSTGLQREVTQTEINAPGRSWNGTTYDVRNGLLRFDTSSLPDGATITGATLTVSNNDRANPDTRNVTIEYYDWNGSSDSDFSLVGDPASFPAGKTAHSGRDISLFTFGQHVLTLENLNYPGNINPGGYTSFRTHISGGTPTGNNYMTIHALENATNPEAQLIVTYEGPDVDYPGKPAGSSYIQIGP